ncbi:hypothetical protein [Bacillus toyonensis]|uniref:hypothetical protein n=1 Tax=Bacillus toyonensis TaxID=155322 RepID=UPI001C0D2D90|nr:hypothetical protein [Bacillus toyonensis]MBU4639423.1 hypothetical protein [Bacillus toyonensis]
MNKEKFLEFVKVFSELHSSEDILITWGAEATLKLSTRIDLELEKFNLTKEEFANECFKIITIASNIASGNINLRAEEEEVQIVNDIFLQDKDLLQYINVHTTSQSQILDEADYELLTKRYKKHINEVLTYSIGLSVNTNNSQRNNKKHINLELSKSDAKQLIEILNQALVDIEQLERGK